MIRKIISGGETGAEQAALDVAIRMEIAHGGSIPPGRPTEKGPLPHRYHLKELSGTGEEDHRENNVLNADGTLILLRGGTGPGTDRARETAVRQLRPFLEVDVEETGPFESVRRITRWLTENDVGILNVTGPSEGRSPGAHRTVSLVLEAVLFLDRLDPASTNPVPLLPPRTVAEAVARLTTDLPLKERATIANLTLAELPGLHHTLGTFIQHRYDLWTGNRNLLASCRIVGGSTRLTEEEATGVIIRELHKSLRQSHRLRVVK